MPIYKRLQKLTLTKEQHEYLLELRELESLKFYRNQEFSRDFLNNQYQIEEIVWSHGDKLYKLAHRFYGDKKLFWIIGLFNNKPTDAHYTYGDVVYIPLDPLRFINDVVR